MSKLRIQSIERSKNNPRYEMREDDSGNMIIFRNSSDFLRCKKHLFGMTIESVDRIYLGHDIYCYVIDVWSTVYSGLIEEEVSP